jgi:lipoprotein-releasing system ATP-binding protein
MSEHGPVLECSGLCKSYREGDAVLSILRGASLSAARGEVVAVTGPSGSGKSTLLNVLGLLDPPDSGRVFIEGTDAWACGETRRASIRNRHIGFVFQFHHLLEEFTLLENVMLPGLLGGLGRGEAADRASALLDEVGILPRAGQFPSRVSGGERQRAAVARAILCSPGVVLADEPTGNLDSSNSTRVVELLLGLARNHGQAFVIATHSTELARRADRVVRISEGLLESV